MPTMKQPIVFYGANWCPDCRRSKDFLEQHHIAFDYIDIDSVPGAADKVAEINHGLKSIPTIVFPDDTILVEPSNDQLGKQLAL